MNTGKVLDVVSLHSRSAEYEKVKSDFNRTVKKEVVKVVHCPDTRVLAIIVLAKT